MDRDTPPRRRSSGSSATIVVLVYALIPVIWIISLSLKTPETIGDGSFLPDASGRCDNYSAVFRAAGFFNARAASTRSASR